MARVVTIEGSIPEDFPESFREPANQEAAKNEIRGLLPLRPQDQVIIKIREA